jgi:hypothetical protein
MGLFDFFKKKSSEQENNGKPPVESVDPNHYLLDVLAQKLIEMGYIIEKSQQYIALTVNSELEIATFIIDDPNNHPSLIHLMVLAIHKNYFPNGIQENIVGLGDNLKEKVDSVLENYLSTTFVPIMDSFSDNHYPDLDFFTNNTREILWHPKLGGIAYQGQWKEKVENEPLFDLLKEKIKTKLPDQKLNWLKLYVARQPQGDIIGECLLNNQPWEEGLTELIAYAKQWPQKGDFLGQKQFIMFRQCDKYEIL